MHTFCICTVLVRNKEELDGPIENIIARGRNPLRTKAMIYKGVVFFCGPKNDSTGIDMKTIHYYGLHSTWYLSKPRIDDEGCADYEYFVAEGSKAYYGH